ncbi:MAG: thioredoxin domain-containing protein [Chloroflexi bacterium]|nr:thioredoxin domain-containing protein [Chloroflexota bacterium]
MPNRLANETSPYLLQHAGNPVDWYPWGDEALERAKTEDKPILLSIGYSACHWCHVMAHESFEDESIAALMNERFVCIKVDREERPDVDGIYMAAVQTLTGSGGWPLTVFLTPDARPYYGGTYFPPEDRGQMPGFTRVLEAMADAYSERKGEVLQATGDITGRLLKMSSPQRSTEPLSDDLFQTAFNSIARGFDWNHGGFGQQPKFPQPLVLDVVLRQWARTGASATLEMVELTLEKMARGGMYDQIGGGFARYSTDAMWLVPHFEKMLYDNALLVSLYTRAFQATQTATKKALYKRVVEETLAFVELEMSHPLGGFYSSYDADSEGVEGKFYVWTPDQIDAVLGESDGPVIRAYYNIEEGGNFEGDSIPWLPRDLDEVASELGMPEEDVLAVVERSRPKLFTERAKRVPPGLDDKVLVSWNAMMLTAFAEAGAAFDRPGWIDRARDNAAFLLDSLFDGDRLLRTWKATPGGKESPDQSKRKESPHSSRGKESPDWGKESPHSRKGSAKIPGYLEDYALLGGALVTLYESTFEQRWLDEARRLADGMFDLFWSAEEEVFYDTGSDASELFTRPRDVFDNAVPCGGSAAANFLLRLSTHTGEPSYRRSAGATLLSVRDYMEKSGSGFGGWLAALDYYLTTPKEMVVIGPADNADTRALLREVHNRYIPNRVIAGAPAPISSTPTPLLEGRVLVNNAPTAYVCENYACQLPVNDPAALAAQLDA